MAAFPVGARVRMTRAFLRNTGQFTGADANGKWIVQDCPCDHCQRGEWIATDEPAITSYYTAEELAAMPWLRMRHINAGNVELVKRR